MLAKSNQQPKTRGEKILQPTDFEQLHVIFENGDKIANKKYFKNVCVPKSTAGNERN